jgi:hypothetical protein
LVTAILETAGEFVLEVPSVLSVPLVIWFMLSIFFSFWMTVALYLYSSGE